MRLTNPDDQNVIKRLFPDNLGDFSEMLPILDIGEGLIVGDASLLPSRVVIDRPSIKPSSARRLEFKRFTISDILSMAQRSGKPIFNQNSFNSN